jgi:hypothetical protein
LVFILIPLLNPKSQKSEIFLVARFYLQFSNICISMLIVIGNSGYEVSKPLYGAGGVFAAEADTPPTSWLEGWRNKLNTPHNSINCFEPPTTLFPGGFLLFRKIKGGLE